MFSKEIFPKKNSVPQKSICRQIHIQQNSHPAKFWYCQIFQFTAEKTEAIFCSTSIRIFQTDYDTNSQDLGSLGFWLLWNTLWVEASVIIELPASTSTSWRKPTLIFPYMFLISLQGPTHIYWRWWGEGSEKPWRTHSSSAASLRYVVQNIVVLFFTLRPMRSGEVYYTE